MSTEIAGSVVGDRASDEPVLIVDVEGFEGPLDLLLTLARQQKVDLSKISVLALADQYLAFIETARQLRLDLAADYLVMAAWLAFLKSRLLLPESGEAAGPSAADIATALAMRLRRLELIRDAADRLFARPQLDRDVFARGAPEPIVDIKQPLWTATLYDLLSAYARQRSKSALSRVRIEHRKAWSLAHARERLERMLDTTQDWGRLDQLLLIYAIEPEMRATAYASTFAATLEMVREGGLDVHQRGAFAPIYLRRRVAGPPPDTSVRPGSPPPQTTG
jgi:segregation and condensation protein A